MILAASLLGGVLLCLAAGGRLASIATVRLRGEWLMAALLLVQVLSPGLQRFGVPASVLYWIWLVTFPVMTMVCAWNWRRPGMLLAAAGLVLNAVVIASNGGMPISDYAAAVAGASAESAAVSPADFVHRTADVTSSILPLADVLPVAGPRLVRSVVSVGDVLLGCGVASFLAGASLSTRLPRLPQDHCLGTRSHASRTNAEGAGRR